jgi:hypothetical protein
MVRSTVKKVKTIYPPHLSRLRLCFTLPITLSGDASEPYRSLRS